MIGQRIEERRGEMEWFVVRLVSCRFLHLLKRLTTITQSILCKTVSKKVTRKDLIHRHYGTFPTPEVESSFKQKHSLKRLFEVLTTYKRCFENVDQLCINAGIGGHG